MCLKVVSVHIVKSLNFNCLYVCGVIELKSLCLPGLHPSIYTLTKLSLNSLSLHNVEIQAKGFHGIMESFTMLLISRYYTLYS